MQCSIVGNNAIYNVHVTLYIISTLYYFIDGHWHMYYFFTPRMKVLCEVNLPLIVAYLCWIN